MMRQLKYASGMTFNRIEDLQKKLGVPLPESTQWKLVRDAAELMKPVHSALKGHYRIFYRALHRSDMGEQTCL